MSFTKITNAGFGLTTGTLVGVAASFSSTVSVGGTLTYEDVTNVDSVGLITARNGIEVTDKGVQVGTGATVDSAASNTLSFLTGGSERLRIDSNGKLILTPGADSGNIIQLNGADATSEILELGINATGNVQLTATHASGGSNTCGFIFRTRGGSGGTTEKLRITSAGSVGIGTTNPGRALQISQANSTAYSGTDFDQDYHVLKLNNFTDSKTVGMQFLIGSNGEAAITATETSDGATDLIFGTRGSGSRAERLRITSAGAVTIGTDAPPNSATLTVRSANAEISAYSSAGGSSKLSLGDINDHDDGSIRYVNGSGYQYMLFSTAATERLRITSAGKVGINQASPSAPLSFNTGTGQKIELYNSGDNNEFGFGLEASELRICSGTSSFIGFRTGGYDGTERLRITAGGLVGIQVTPTQQRLTIDVFNTGTTQASYDGINICNTSSTTNNGSAIIFGQQVAGNSNARIGVINSDRSSGSEDQDIFFGTLGGGSYAERMRITSDGNLNLGSATRFQTYKGIELYLTGDPTFAGCTANNNPGAYTTLAKFSGYSQSGSNFRENACIVMETDTANNSGNAAGRIIFRTEANNETNGVTSRMMLDCKGRMDIFASENNAIDIHTAYTGSTGALVVKSGATDLDTGSSTFILYADGDCENTNNSYGALSDQKLKENIVDASSQWNNIKDIRIRNFNFIEGQTHTQIGVVAQQVETVSPGLVKDIIDRDKDGNDLGTVTKSVKYSVLYMKSVKALQEAMARIETLEAKVAALEGS